MPSTSAQWIQALATVFVGIVGVVIANSFRRQMRVKLSDSIVKAYSRLWSISGPGAIDIVRGPEDRSTLARLMLDWYFDDGNGLVMSKPSRRLFFVIVGNLELSTIEGVKPLCLEKDLLQKEPSEASEMLACRLDAQLSRLRTQMKSDLAIYNGTSHLRESRRYERDLLTLCGIRNGIPVWRRPESTWCHCGHCGQMYGMADLMVDILQFRRRQSDVAS